MKVLVLGHYGGRNFGDELMLAGLVRLLGRQQPCVIRIQTPDGSVSQSLRALGVQDGYSKSPLQILKGVLWADAVVLGGGTIFHDAYPDERYQKYWRNLLIISLIFVFARLCRRHVSLAGVGIGPLRRGRTRMFTTLLKWSAHDISVRDQQSLDDLASLPGRQDKVRLADDLSAFADLGSTAPSGGAAANIVGLSLVPPAVVSGAAAGQVEALYDALAGHLSASLGSGAIDRVVLFSANVGKDSDLPVAMRMITLLSAHADKVEHVAFDGNPAHFVQRLGECKQVLAARYHVAIVTTTLRIPTLWLAYQRKVMDAAPGYGVAASDIFDLSELCGEGATHGRLFDRIGSASFTAAPRSGRVLVDPTSAVLQVG